MAARSIGRGTISLGMVSIPVKLYTATRAQSVSFNMLHAECGSRVSQQLVCLAHGEPARVLERTDTVKAFEHTRGEYVRFTDEELKAIEAARPTSLDLVEFVPENTVDLLFVERTYYLGPDKGGDDAYHVLARALERTKRIGVGTFANRGKDTLVLIRPYRGGLLLHEAYYAHEVLPFAEVDLGHPRPMSPLMLRTAELLVERLEKPAFEPERFRDEWAAKVLAVVERKVAGEDVTIAPATPRAQIVDLEEALKRSVAQLADKVKSKRDAVASSREPGAQSVIQPKGPKKAAPRSKPEGKKRGRREG